MITITDKSQCSGCTACATSCGVKAIKMVADSQGFKYPVVDNARCMDCGMCEKVCPFKPGFHYTETPMHIYGARLKTASELAKSQSGGAFKAIADWAIDNNYTVYGASFDKAFNVKHEKAKSKDEIERFRGSKYVQSDLDGIFADIVQKLRKHEKILFTGTGCQIAGLKSLCKQKHIDTSTLLTVDLICYGVPSPQYWQDYLKYIRKKFKHDIVQIRFRDKVACGWNSSQSSITFDNGKKIFPANNFYNPLLFRRSCSVCPFTSFSRTSDITIGDFWGIEKIKPEYVEDNRGISLMMIHTSQGARVFDAIKNDLDYFETDKETASQPQLQRPNPMHPKKDAWEKTYEDKGFERAIRRFGIIVDPNPVRVRLGALKHKLFDTLFHK